jgi:cytoskeletal protein RodZ
MGSILTGADGATGLDAYSRVEADSDPVTVESLVFASGQTFGEGLRAGREFLGLDLQTVADATKIRSHYLSALEAMDLSQLPSRPFILGYVRAYARVLEVDEERAVARFRQDAPDPDEPLRAPVGVPKTADPRFGLLGAAAGIVIAAIVVWNVAQRAMAEHDPNPSKGAAATIADTPTGPVQLGEALPPPQESTLPDPYVTPGLAPEVTGVEAAPVKVGPLRPPLEARAFAAKGAIHGAPATQSQIVIQAQRSVSLVARGGDGKVYFAQQLKGGEAYRVPMLPGLLIDVSSPEAMEVFVGGALAGTLTEPVTPLSAIVKAAPPPPPAPVAAPAAAPVAGPSASAPAATTQQSSPATATAPAPRPAAKPAATAPAPKPARAPSRTYARVPQETTPAPTSAATAPSALAPAQ